jgi:hypothetical protein
VKTKKIFMIALMLLFLVTGLEASSKSKQTNATTQINTTAGPTSNPNKSICPPCPNFTCPMVSPSGTTGATGISGCTGPANLCCIIIQNNLTTTTSLNIATAEITGDALVQLNAHVKEDLTVDGKATFVNNVCVQNDKTVCQDVSIEGFAIVLGTLTISSGGLNASGAINVTGGNANINGSLTVTGNKNVTGNLEVNGAGIFNGTLVASGGLEVFNGSTINNGGLTILNPSGCTGCTGAFINGNVCIIGNVIANDVTVLSELIVDEIATLNNATTATGGTLITNGQVIFNDGLTITGNELLTGGNKIVGGNLSVSGNTIFQSPIVAHSGAMISGGLVVMGGSTVDSLDLVSGNLSVSGTLDVNGPITSANGLSTLASLTITDTTNSFCPAGPAALVVLGGVGIGSTGPAIGAVGRDLWLGGSEFFANVSREGGIPTSFDFYEESCFSTAFTWGGLTVNPPAFVSVKVIRVGNIVNLLIPQIIYNNPGIHIDVIKSTNPIPERFRPFVTVRGAASTIISNIPGIGIIGGLGEFDVSPAGIITFGLPASTNGPLGTASDALGPQRIFSQDFVEKDIDSITYNINSCKPRCKFPCP